MRRKLIGLCLAVTTVSASNVNAQATQSNLVLEEIIVTAQRKEQSLQDVPLSITAFSAETIERANISEAKDFLSMSPNVGFTEDGQAGSRSVSVSVRGVSSITLDSIASPQSIGYYVDQLNVGVTATGNVNPQLQDMERIEVLRGPQGTYFGRNALGGAINVTTKKPNQDNYSEVSVSAGSFSTFGLEGIVNIPVSETFMLRGVAAYEQSESPVENVNPNSDNDTEFKSFRGSARWLPSEDIIVDLSINHTDENEGGDIAVASGVTDLDTQSIFGPLVFDDGLGFYPENDDRVNHNLREVNDNDTTIFNFRVVKDFGAMTFTSITGVIDSDAERVFDQDNLSVDAINRFNKAEANSFSQEFRLSSNNEEGFRWTAGVYFADDEILRFNSVQAGSEGTYIDPRSGEAFGLLPPIPAGFRINENNLSFETESTALFGEASWDLSDKLSFTLGGRYTKDQVTNSAFDVVGFESPVPDTNSERDFDNFSPKASLRYRANDHMTWYATYSEGYKAGGIDSNNGVSTNFEEEQLKSLEVGFKSTLAGGRMQLSGAVFTLDWEDLQVQTNFLADPNDISSAVSRTLNAAEADSEGAEIEFLGLLNENLKLGINAGYLDGQYGSFPNVNLPGGNSANLTGLDLPKTPEWTLGASLDYVKPFGSAGREAYARLEWNYRSEMKGDLEGVAAAQLGLPDFPYNVDSYNVANIRLGISDPKWRLNAYVENLFDEEYYTGTSDNFGLAGIRLRPHPTVFGVKFTYMFGN